MAKARRRKTTKKRKNSMQTAFVRFMLVVAFFIFWIGAVSVRLVHLQVNEHDKWKHLTTIQQQYRVKSKAMRGTVRDRNGEPLAMSVPSYSLTLDPSMVTDPDKTAEAIAPFLKLDAKKFAKKIRDYRKRQFMYVAREIDEDVEKKIREQFFYDKNGERKPHSKYFSWHREQKREYPNGTLASQVIGVSNREDVGQSGIERSQERFLKAQEIKRIMKRDRSGRIFDEIGETGNTVVNESKDVFLTLDIGFQNIAEKALAEGIKKTNAKSGKAVVLSVKTGEVLAMANYPTFDPNRLGKIKPADWRNRAIQDEFSPGSTFKLVTFAGALEEGQIAANDEVDCSKGQITVGGYTFKDSHNVGKASYEKAFAESSNVGAIKTGLDLGKKKFYAYAKDFGFGKRTQIGLPGEGSGMIKTPNTWSGSTLASMSIGYSVNVTTLQSAMAFATIANDGVQISPSIVKHVRDKAGTTVHKNEIVKKRIVSKRTAQQLRAMMSAVVLDGTAKKASLNGYSAAGKTGTAWKYSETTNSIDKTKYVASFVGFAPVDDPEIVIAVTVDEPRGALRYGGDVAAPIFSVIAQKILTDMGVTPDVEVFQRRPEERLSSEDESETEEDLTPKKKDPKVNKKKTKKAPIPPKKKEKTIKKPKETKT